MKGYIFNLLTAIDQLGNAIAGGNPDVTVSGRVGYNALTTQHWYWKLLERIINWTFEPIDVPNHCYDTYITDNDVDNYPTSNMMFVLLSFIAVTTCIVLLPMIRLVAVFI